MTNSRELSRRGDRWPKPRCHVRVRELRRPIATTIAATPTAGGARPTSDENCRRVAYVAFRYDADDAALSAAVVVSAE